MTVKKKLIEVALPPEAINQTSAREKSMDFAVTCARLGAVRVSL